MSTTHAVGSACRRVRQLVLPVAAGLAVTGMSAAAAQPSAHQAGGGVSGFLNGVSAVSASDAWAVGEGSSGALIMHWNGSSWSAVNSPNAPSCALHGVSMDSATDGWAVGNCVTKTLIEHWNGATWSRVPGPNPSPENQLFGVSMVSAADGWAVGTVLNSGQVHRPLVLHWNGTAWSPVPVSVPGGDSGLFAVSAASASDAWAVGWTRNARDGLVLHWNGTTWSQVLIPRPFARTPLGVSDASPGNAWAVGVEGEGEPTKTLTLHWNGTAWRQVASPSPGQPCSGCAFDANDLSAVATLSRSNAWSVGQYTTSTGGHAALTLHWTGIRWALVPNQGGTSDSFLRGISMVSATDGWAVGGHLPTTGKVIILHWNGTTWSRS